MALKSLFDELIHPEKKCARLGHAKPYTRDGVGFALPSYVHRTMAFRCREAVAYRVALSVECCSRCKAEIEPPKVTKVIRATHSLAMPDSRWDLLDELGYVWES